MEMMDVRIFQVDCHYFSNFDTVLETIVLMSANMLYQSCQKRVDFQSCQKNLKSSFFLIFSPEKSI